MLSVNLLQNAAMQHNSHYKVIDNDTVYSC